MRNDEYWTNQDLPLTYNNDTRNVLVNDALPGVLQVTQCLNLSPATGAGVLQCANSSSASGDPYGTGRFLFTPNTTFNGNVTYEYVACNTANISLCSVPPAQVTIHGKYVVCML